jgi:hypothetical protein
VKTHLQPCSCPEGLEYQVLRSNAGYYVGRFCPECGPYDRASGYFEDSEDAAAHLKDFNGETMCVLCHVQPAEDGRQVCKECHEYSEWMDKEMAIDLDEECRQLDIEMAMEEHMDGIERARDEAQYAREAELQDLLEDGSIESI